MIIIGSFIRGPACSGFGPTNVGPQSVDYEVNIDLPDILGITSNLQSHFGAWFRRVQPRWARLSCLVRRYNPKDYQRMSLLQYSIVMVFLLTMVALPAKMMLRLLWHIKYVWITPWFNI
jgi:hypothetical protein